MSRRVQFGSIHDMSARRPNHGDKADSPAQHNTRRTASGSREKSSLDTPRLRFIISTNPEEERAASTRRAVRSHVVRNYHAERRQAWRVEDEKADPSLRSPCQCRQGPTWSLSSPEICAACGGSLRDRTPSTTSALARRSTENLLVPVGPGGADPFSSYPANDSPRVHILVDHFLSVVGPGINTFITSTGSSADPIRTIYIPFSLKDPAVFHGLLLLAARSYAVKTNDESYHVTALSHKIECIRLVNESLGTKEKGTSDAIIAAILMLAVEETTLGNWQIFKHHLNGVHTIVRLRGGAQKLGLGGLLQNFTIALDRACQMYNDSDPQFTRPEDQLEGLPPIRVPPGFYKVLQSSKWSIETISFLVDACCQTLLKLFSGYSGTTAGELAYADKQSQPMQDQIIHLYSQNKQTDDIPEEVCVYWAICIYRAVILRSIPADWNIVIRLGEGLREALQRMPIRRHWWVSEDKQEMLLWIAFMGANSSETGSELRAWFVLLLRQVLERCGLKTWEQARRRLSEFLWTERCEVLGPELWREVGMIGVSESKALEFDHLPMIGVSESKALEFDHLPIR